MANKSYPNIDMVKTGLLLKHKIQQAGYTVKDIQEKLLLSCPQPIYRWYQGKVLPSVNHLYVLSNLLNVHMEELLVPQEAYSTILQTSQSAVNRAAIVTMPQAAVEMEYTGVRTVARMMFFTENSLDTERRMLAYFWKWTVA